MDQQFCSRLVWKLDSYFLFDFQLSGIKKLEQRLNMMLFKRKFPEEMQDIKPVSSCPELKVRKGNLCGAEKPRLIERFLTWLCRYYSVPRMKRRKAHFLASISLGRGRDDSKDRCNWQRENYRFSPLGEMSRWFRVVGKYHFVQFLILCFFSQNVVNATAACREVKTSPKFSKFLELVLLMGNYMNAGSRNEGSMGFEMNYLTKVSELHADFMLFSFYY